MQEKMDMTEYFRAHVKKRYLRAFVRKTCHFLGRVMPWNRLRIMCYRAMGMKIGENVFIGLDCYFDSDYAELVTIEDNAWISFRVIIVAHDAVRAMVSPVIVKRGARVAAAAIVLPGVTVGRGAVVGAGALVGVDVPDGATVIGNPGRVMLPPKPDSPAR